ncbi:type IV toxin-antitoxin system AbiEi family antitoxin domain-containing protein [Lacticaseibacillus suihuaensis]
MEQQIRDILRRNNGQITSQDLKATALNPRILFSLAQRGELERIERGVYIDPAIFEDDMSSLQYRFSRGVYFKDTALFLHHMLDRTPERYQMNFPAGYHATRISAYPVDVFTQKRDWYELGIEEVMTPGQHLVRVYNIERTLCDILRTRDQSDSETIRQAMREYTRMKQRNIGRLIEYANLFNVRSRIDNYLEVLL